MIEAIIFTGTKDYSKEIAEVRNKVFGHMELYEPNYFCQQDDNSSHVLVFENNEPIATGRLVKCQHYTIDGIAVLEENRHMSIGDLVVKMLIDSAFNNLCDYVYVESEAGSAEFFMKIGFKKVESKTDKLSLYRIKQSDIKKKCQQH